MNDPVDFRRSTFRTLMKIAPHLLFWGWNVVFLALVLFGVGPLVGAALVLETIHGLVPWTMTAAVAAVVLTPVAATALGAMRLRRDPGQLFRLFYAVEMPLFAMALSRLFLVRDLTPAVGLLLVAASVAVGSYLYRLVRGAEETTPRAALLALAGDAVGLAVAAYAAAVLFFFALPVGAMMVVGFFRFEWLRAIFEGLSRSPALVLLLAAGFTLFVLSASIFALAPPVLITLFVRRFLAGFRAASAVVGRRRAALGSLATVATLALAVVISARQPHHAALAMLASPPEGDAARLARLGAASTLRAGLVHAYLAPWRHLGDVSRHGAVRDLWQQELGSGSALAEAAQGAFNGIARPFLFEGESHESARRAAADRYAGFFDRSIQHGEKDTILGALAATWSREDREAGLLTAGERKVRVARQEVRVISEEGALAEIEIHEVYENQTSDPQEVLYFLSLPETAAITGLWLGEVELREDAFAFTVSPRGAAQRVYRAEVQARRDPALMEQVGPRQYRLRAFPIAPRQWSARGRMDVFPAPAASKPMHLWVRYRVLADQGAFALPHLIEARNAYRDRRTARLVEGRDPRLAPDLWLPPSIPAKAKAPRELRARIDAGTVIVARPEPAPVALPAGKRLAVVVDRSFSMSPRARDLTAALGFVRDRVARDNDVDLYLTSAASRGEPASRVDDPGALDPASIVFYGGQDPADLLSQFAELRGEAAYDGVVVLTDEGGFDLAGPKREARDLGAPVWMVHLGGAPAPGYDDATLATIQQRGGGVVTRVEDAFTRLAASAAHAGDPRDLGWADGYRFSLVDGDDAPDSAFAPIAAHRFIPIAARTRPLDDVHRIARDASVVSPFSSMIVLVNDAQREALRRAEAQANRFDRDTENGEASLRAPPPALGGGLTGTPEPEEWALLALVALGLAWVAKKQANAARLGGAAAGGGL